MAEDMPAFDSQAGTGYVNSELFMGQGGSEVSFDLNARIEAIAANAQSLCAYIYNGLHLDEQVLELGFTPYFEDFVGAGTSDGSTKRYQLMKRAVEELGNRLTFLEGVRDFFDSLGGCVCLLEVSGDVESFKQGLAEIGNKLNSYLRKEATNAFTVEFDFEQGTYEVRDVQINVEDLLRRWEEFEATLSV